MLEISVLYEPWSNVILLYDCSYNFVSDSIDEELSETLFHMSSSLLSKVGVGNSDMHVYLTASDVKTVTTTLKYMTWMKLAEDLGGTYGSFDLSLALIAFFAYVCAKKSINSQD